ncbi:acyclic terpene utilization AtuA family protein [Peribacillus frigoritolerans]|uniref:acyclic terpene utilization AtuA family protein n=1 Tax=Peribacillus frigoritolerans TaxID=450367 RepID=UPI00300BDB35
MKKIRIGSGAGYAGDRIEPAMELIQKGNLDYIIFECLAERTIALAQQEKMKNPDKGYNHLLKYRMEKVLSLCIENDVTLITNMGAANPLAAAKFVKQLAEEKGIGHLKIAAVSGDDVYPNIGKYMDCTIIETGVPLKEVKSSIISANAYIGISGIVSALREGADIVITGRVSDPSLVVAPLKHEFGWEDTDYELLGKGTAAGHLLECGAQVTGGYFADPGYKDVPDLWNVGYPIAEVQENGNFLLTKLEVSGGMVTAATVKEQVVYEIHDPTRYLTPDVIADFSQIEVIEKETNQVHIKGVSGKEKSGYYKTSIGYLDGYIVEAEISYGGSGCLGRSRLAEEVVRHRLIQANIEIQEIRFDHIGSNSLYGSSISEPLYNKEKLSEVRLRVAARTADKVGANLIGQEVEALYTNGPAGGGGVRVNVQEVVSIASILIPSEDITIDVTYEEVDKIETQASRSL